MEENRAVQCPAMLIAAADNGTGRTTITAALARYHRDQGRRVRVFKAGADFLGPHIHSCASGGPVDVLDLWLVGQSKCLDRLYHAACDADLILVECTVGVYDTNSACIELARSLGLPLMMVVDGSDTRHTATAMVDEIVSLGTAAPLAGVLINKIRDDATAGMIEHHLKRCLGGDAFVGQIPFHPALAFPWHHHQLLSEEGVERLDQFIVGAAAVIEEAGVVELPEPVSFYPAPQTQVPLLLEGIRIGVARDEAFAFIYQANLDLLESMGAKLFFFSPLHDRYLPDVESLWFPGGFPELYIQQLEENQTMKTSIREFHDSGKTILAECGGMMYMLASLVSRAGVESSMVGLLPGRSTMLDHLADMGMQSINFDDQVIRGSVFHHSRMESGMEPVSISNRRHGRRPGETLYQLDGLVASYVHFYFPSNLLLTAKFFGSPIFASY